MTERRDIKKVVQYIIWIFFVVILVCVAGAFLTMRPAHSQHQGHPPQDMALHEQFYSKWKRHDTKTSCCNKKDCYPTAAHYDSQSQIWWAKRREDGQWLMIPKTVYDQDNPEEVRSPDGQSHLCAPDPNDKYYRKYYGSKFVFCFTPGEGI